MSSIHVDGVRIRVAGLTPGQGQQLGARVGALLGEYLAQAGAPASSGPVRVRIEAHGESVEQLAGRIVLAIRDSL